jgi:hypothetical protein
MNDGANTYRVIETHRTPGGSVWTLVRQESESVTDLAVISAHESRSAAESAKADVERWDIEREAVELRC